ncbi:hypothetical protein Dimus_010994 [Dionaea muscipula]
MEDEDDMARVVTNRVLAAVSEESRSFIDESRDASCILGDGNVNGLQQGLGGEELRKQALPADVVEAHLLDIQNHDDARMYTVDFQLLLTVQAFSLVSVIQFDDVVLLYFVSVATRPALIWDFGCCFMLGGLCIRGGWYMLMLAEVGVVEGWFGLTMHVGIYFSLLFFAEKDAGFRSGHQFLANLLLVFTVYCRY